MTGYKITAGDVEAGPQDRMEVLVQKKSSTGWLWKLLAVLLLLALCLGGARLYVWYQLERSEPTTQAGNTAAPFRMDSEEAAGARSTLQEMSKKAKAAIHLEGHYDERGNATAVEWRDRVGQAFSQGNFRLQDNRIVIPESGLYFVYSQASFRVSRSGDQEGEWRPPTLSHRVRRMSRAVGTRVSLLSAVRSACQSVQEDGERSGHGCYSTIYLGAVFQLDRGDTLDTESNPLKELDTDEGKTFFGLFAL
ncbi:tumor necrosis factor b (TNF superfamily, member 2) [Poeciliopsis prolifica]|uniref:tumor necrosis factor b (TNF superfamily, member 2) n=1 Tax=Poeciliopsis prolifica TaxID=188132 RepID=UPI00241414AD|nr:tumor necrosis factor b (TNF superfamily, member 2) [Poeciliopsis prolifica]